MHKSAIPHFILDLHSIGKHPYLDTQYQMLNPKHINSTDLGAYQFVSMIAVNGENVFTTINNRYSQALKEKWGIEKSMVIGIANKHSERDIALFYTFDDSGIAQGLFICSLDGIDIYGKVVVEKSLDEMFHIPELSECEAEDRLNQRYRFRRKKPPITLKAIEKRAGDRLGYTDRYLGGADGYHKLLKLF